MKLFALMTVYNEAKFLDCSIRSIQDHVDGIVIVEGAYEETVRLGMPKRSNDGTLEIIGRSILNMPCEAAAIKANEKSDAQQRNVGLEKIKEMGADFFMIVDGDEVYLPHHFKLIRKFMEQPYDAHVFTCNTFVNDFWHYTEQRFPRLFRLYGDSEFTNDNFVRCNGKEWGQYPVSIANIDYFHYAFVKGEERFLTKKEWWESRFGEGFRYDWEIKDGVITPDNHTVFEHTGSHPAEIIEKFGL